VCIWEYSGNITKPFLFWTKRLHLRPLLSSSYDDIKAQLKSTEERLHTQLTAIHAMAGGSGPAVAVAVHSDLEARLEAAIKEKRALENLVKEKDVFIKDYKVIYCYPFKMCLHACHVH
jgi:hypothetical protein